MCAGVDVIAITDGFVTHKDTYLDSIKLTERIDEIPVIGAAVSLLVLGNPERPDQRSAAASSRYWARGNESYGATTWTQTWSAPA